MGPKTTGLLLWLGQLVPMNPLVCLLRGHDDGSKNEPGRKYLQCFRCGRETPGWHIDTRRQQVKKTSAPKQILK